MTSYVKDIAVVITDDPNPPDNCLKDLNTSANPDINGGFGGKYIYLIPKRTNIAREAAVYIQIIIRDSEISGQSDLAEGAGGKFRYIKLIYDASDDEKITKVALYRKSNNDSPVTLDDAVKIGFNRVSSDINKDRSGDFLHLIYRVSN